MASPNRRLAVLIDADNAPASVIDELFAEITRYGTATVKRAYGDWTTPNLASWKNVLHKLAVSPIQQFAYTSGKNATDSALIIDAMDLLHAGGLDGFCVVSSDSDYTRLATRIREDGLLMYGFGERKTPEPFVAACDKFIYTEILKPARAEASDNEAPPADLEPMIRTAVDAAAQEDGWARLSVLGSMIAKNHPAFDSRNYGCSKPLPVQKWTGTGVRGRDVPAKPDFCEATRSKKPGFWEQRRTMFAGAEEEIRPDGEFLDTNKLGDLVRRLPYLEVNEVRNGSANVQLRVRFAS